MSLYLQNIQHGLPLGNVKKCSGNLPFYNRYTNEVLSMRIWWWQAHMGHSYTHHYPHTTFRHCSPYRTLFICFFVITQSEQICKWGIEYGNLVMTDHVGSTSAHHYPHTKVHYCSPYRTLEYLPLLLLANQRTGIGFKYAHSVMTCTHGLFLYPPLPTYHIGYHISSL